MKKMNEGSVVRSALLALVGVAAAAVGMAQGAAPTRVALATPAAAREGCIQLRSVAQMEQDAVDEKGQKVRRLVPAAAVTPGSQVVWTITASNVCDKPVGNVFIDNPVPEHMSFVAESAFGAGSQISYSLDGQRYAQPEALTVREADATQRTARAEEYSHIRWVFQNPIAPGQVAIARFRAVVK